MTNRVLLGNLGGGEYGLKVSKAGIDVLSAADRELLFNSQGLNLRILATGFIPGVADTGSSRVKFQSDSSNHTGTGGIDIVLPALDYEPVVLLIPSFKYSDGQWRTHLTNDFFPDVWQVARFTLGASAVMTLRAQVRVPAVYPYADGSVTPLTGYANARMNYVVMANRGN